MNIFKPLQYMVYEHLKDEIINNRINYDEIYSETRIAKNLGVSRTPVRDAVHRLSHEGYIDILPNKGFVLHRLSAREIEEIFQMRSAIESYCTKLIAENHKMESARSLFDNLEKLLDLQMETIEEGRNISSFIENDFLFHNSIVEYSGNKIFVSFIDEFTYRIKKMEEISMTNEDQMKNSYMEHYSIFQAMKTGDVANINELTMIHMEIPKYTKLKRLTSRGVFCGSNLPK